MRIERVQSMNKKTIWNITSTYIKKLKAQEPLDQYNILVVKVIEVFRKYEISKQVIERKYFIDEIENLLSKYKENESKI